jgi:hypothetical protein
VAEQRGERGRQRARAAQKHLDQGRASNLAANLRGERQRGHYYFSVARRRVRGEAAVVRVWWRGALVLSP